MFKELLNTIEEKYNNIKNENNELNSLMQTTTTFKNLNLLNESLFKNEASEYIINYIMNECPDINLEKATLISRIIPLEETYIDVFYTKEILTNKELLLIPTNKYIWLINKNEYGVFYYDNLNIKIIKNSLMSKIVLLNNILLEINGNDTKINNLLLLINNKENREKIISEKISYLCGIIPIYQKRNAIGTGISIDKDNNIVFHSKDRNYKKRGEEIENYEVLLDNSIYISKKAITTNTIGSFQTNCFQISMRITTKNNEIFILPILEPNNFGTKYNSHDTAFKNAIDFTRIIMEKLNEITPKY